MHKFLMVTLFVTLYGVISHTQSQYATYSDPVNTENTDDEDDSPSGIPPVPLWIEVYSEGNYEKDKTPDAMLFVNLGKRLPLPGAIDIYGKSKINTGNQKYYWNNRADLGLGIRYTIESKVSITGFAEYLAGYYMQTNSVQIHINGMYNQLDSIDNVIRNLNTISVKSHYGLKQNLDSLFDLNTSSLTQTRDSLKNALRAVEDAPNGVISEIRGGMTFWNGWGQEYTGSSPMHFWGNMYSELVGTILKKKTGSVLDSTRKDVLLMNTVLYVKPEIGISTKQTVVGSLVLSLDADYGVDIMGDAENNRLLAGAVLHYIPFKSIYMDINAGYFAGTYFRRSQNSEPLPKKGIFATFKTGFSFWYGLGL